MSFSNAVYKTANAVLEKEREKNRYIVQKRKEEISEKIPEYKALKKELVTLLGDYVKIVGSGNKVKSEDVKTKVYENEKMRKKILSDNGYPENYLDDIFSCELCKDTGYVNGERCNCYKKLLVETAVLSSNLKNILDKQNFENFDINIFSEKEEGSISPKANMKNILSHAKKFIDNFKNEETKSLLFTGNTGVGKTYLSSCIAKAILESGNSVLYHSSAKITEILEKNKFSNYTNPSVEDINDLYNFDLLIIDDLGTEFKTSYTLSAIYELINSRLINNKKTIISTNLSVKELKEIYTERLFSRFLGEFTILEFLGEDLRTQEIFKING